MSNSNVTRLAIEAAAPVIAWYKRNRARRTLSRMSDRLLADLGVEREAIATRLAEAEAAAAALRADRCAVLKAAKAGARAAAEPAPIGQDAIHSAA